MSVKRSDPRVVRTRELLRESLMALITEKSFESISIREITERVALNRSTFYTHYHDIYHLLADCGIQLLRPFTEDDPRLENLNPVQALESAIKGSLNVHAMYPEFTLLLYKQLRNSPYLTDFWEGCLNCPIVWQHSLQPDEGGYKFSSNILAEFCIGGSVDVIIRWLESGMVIPTEDLAAQLLAMNLACTREVLSNDAVKRE